MDEVRILTPTGMLGYGFPVDAFRKGLDRCPHAITVDSGSTDSGPQKLGLGQMTSTEQAYERDLEVLIDAGKAHGIPVYVSSAGGDGSGAHVDLFVEIARRIAARRGYRLRTAAIYSDIDPHLVEARRTAGRVKPLGPVPELVSDEIFAATGIVAQMGAEPFLEAHARHGDLDLVIAGRSYDPAPIAAVALRHGFDPALAWHMGKIMECGALCAEPAGATLIGRLRSDHFEVEPADPQLRCTPSSVAAHTLYEKSHPFELHGPGGMLDLSACRYEPVGERAVRVSGSRFVPAETFRVKLEGAKPVGFRAIAIQGTRDPACIAALDLLTARAEAVVREQFADVDPASYRVIFHAYGRDGVMGPLEPVGTPSHEIGLVTEVAAATQELAMAICGRIRTWLLHAPYPGRIATAGNFASPFTPLEIPLGQACEFNIYHLMDLDSPTEPFRIAIDEL